MLLAVIGFLRVCNALMCFAYFFRMALMEHVSRCYRHLELWLSSRHLSQMTSHRRRPGALEVSGEVVVEDRGIEAHTQSEANIVPLPGHHEHDKTRNCEGENFNHLEGDVYAIRLFVFDQGEDPHYEEDDGK